MNSTSRKDVKQLAESIEALAKQVQTTLDSGGSVLALASELARNNITFVFSLGELYANETVGKAPKKATVVKSPSATSRKFVRDSLGRFSSRTNAV